MPGYKSFFFGCALTLGEWEVIRNSGSKKQMKQILGWLHDKLNPEQKRYDSAKHPVTIVNMLSEVQLYISDPEMIQTLFTSKNAIFDKTGEF